MVIVNCVQILYIEFGHVLVTVLIKRLVDKL